MSASVPFDPIVDRYDATRGGERRGSVMADALEPHLAPGGTIPVVVGQR